MLVQNVFFWAAAANKTKPPSKSLQRNARTVEFKEEKRRGFLLLFTLLPFSSLLLVAAVSGRDAVACCNEVPLIYSCSTTLIFLQASKIWLCTLYLFLLIQTARQSILLISPRALLLLLGLQLYILSPEGGVDCSVLTASASWGSQSNEYFHNTECLL
jgi:hypothetical protein